MNHPPPRQSNYNMAAHSQMNMSTTHQNHSNREFLLPPQPSTAQPIISNANVQNPHTPNQHLHDLTKSHDWNKRPSEQDVKLSTIIDRSQNEIHQNNQKMKIKILMGKKKLQIQVTKVQKKNDQIC